jgi:tetratricopeptide (TPR) repeat protein
MDPAAGTGDALDAAFRVAECHYHLDDYRSAIEVLSVIAARADLRPQDRLQAMVQRGICLVEAGELDGAERQLRDSLSYWTIHKEAERLDEYFPAQAQFFLGEIYRLFFENVELDPDKGEEQLGKDLEYKCQMLLSAQGHYLRAIRIGEGRWATAAGFRVGALYENLYHAMLEAKVPQGFDEEQAQVYREELRKKVRVLVSKAIGIYERTLAAAERIGVDNPFIAQTRQSLERMKQILLEDTEREAAGPGGEPSASPVLPAAQVHPSS